MSNTLYLALRRSVGRLNGWRLDLQRGLARLARRGHDFYLMLADWRRPLITVRHCPQVFPLRAADLTANICGVFARHVIQADYRLNGGECIRLGNVEPRVPWPLFTVEIPAGNLRDGRNELRINATSRFGPFASQLLEFNYDPAAANLPGIVALESIDFDVQDGYWETRTVGDELAVGPVAGSEGYDRILNITGALPDAREIRADVVFHRPLSSGKPFGFGVLPLWGGRPDDPGHTPRRGWNFSLVWYYSIYGATGMEFSYKHGADDPDWVAAYRNLPLRAGQRYRIVCQVWPVADGERNGHQYYQQRMKWWPAAETEPDQWLELRDTPGAPIPAGKFSTALIAHCCQVDFLNLRISEFSPPG